MKPRLRLLATFVVAALTSQVLAGGVPADVLKKIKAKAAAEFPNDFATQEYVIRRDSDAYVALMNYRAPGIPADVLKRIMAKATVDFPNDYATQKYVVDREVAAYRRLNPGTSETGPRTEPATEKPTSPERSQVTDFTCPLCKGSRRVTRPGLKISTLPCPVCRGRGSRRVLLRRNEVVCSDCGGMGRIGKTAKTASGNRYSADTCAACRGKGKVYTSK